MSVEFMFVNGKNKKLRVSEESIKWITPQKTVRVFATILRMYIPATKKITLLDMTANHGGDLLGLVNLIRNISATGIEYEPPIFKNLLHNVNQYPNDVRDRIKIYNDDSTKHIDKYYDVIFADPPFGSNYFTYNQKYMLKIGEMTLVDIVEQAKAPIIMLKTPIDPNFDNEMLQDAIRNKGLNYKYYTYRDLEYFCQQGKQHKTNVYIIERPYKK